MTLDAAMKSLMVRSMVLIAATIALFWISTEFATRWTAMTLPSRGATVEMRDGSTLSGDLRRSWTGEWILTSEDGAERIFTEFRSIRFTPQAYSNRPTHERLLWILPQIVVGMAFIGLLVVAWRTIGRKGTSRSDETKR